LKGKQNDAYTYLAAAQKTLFAVTPLHTKNEFQLFKDSVKNDGPFCASRGQPNFHQMAGGLQKQMAKTFSTNC
jgi:hypothetical protein